MAQTALFDRSQLGRSPHYITSYLKLEDSPYYKESKEDIVESKEDIMVLLACNAMGNLER